MIYTDFTSLNCDWRCHVQWTPVRNTRAAYWNNLLPIKSKTPSLSAVNLTYTWSSFSCLFSLFSSGFTLLSSVQMLWLKNSADSVRVVLSLTSVSILSCLSLTSFCCNLPAGCLQEQAYNTNDSYELIIFNESLLKTHKSVLDSRVTGSPKKKLKKCWKCTHP